MEFSVQCDLKACGRYGAGELYITTWLPIKHKNHSISTGDVLTLVDEEGTWEVQRMYGIRPTSEVKERERDWKNQRKASDI